MATNSPGHTCCDLSHSAAHSRAAADGSKTGCKPCRRNSRCLTPRARAKISISIDDDHRSGRALGDARRAVRKVDDAPPAEPLGGQVLESPARRRRDSFRTGQGIALARRIRSAGRRAWQAPGGPASSSADRRFRPWRELPGLAIRCAACAAQIHAAQPPSLRVPKGCWRSARQWGVAPLVHLAPGLDHQCCQGQAVAAQHDGLPGRQTQGPLEAGTDHSMTRPRRKKPQEGMKCGANPPARARSRNT